MGNSLGGKRSAKIMKINGETFKLKTPVQAWSVVENHPGHVLLESDSVRHYGVRAKPLEPHQELKPKRLYFLVELPKFPENRGLRRVNSGIQMSAKDRLESLMLAKRSASDLSIMKPMNFELEEEKTENDGREGLRVKMRLPKAEVQRLMSESKDGADVAEKIVGLCVAGGGTPAARNVHWEGDGGSVKSGLKSREPGKSNKLYPLADKKRVGFLPVDEGEIRLAVGS